MAAIYCFDLSNTPVYFGGDEAHFAVGAHAIATTGRNLNGDRLPVFFNLTDPLGGARQPWGDTWYQPMLFYTTAIVVWLLPFTEWAMRLPVALIGGVLTPWLMFIAGRRLIGDATAALVAAMIVALAPMQVVLSRQALDYVYPLPFIAAWLCCLHAFVRSRNPKYLTAIGALLGVGCYSYIASWMMMPLYLLITWIVAVRCGAKLKSLVISGVAFAAPVMLAVIWVAAHPEMLAQTMTRYGVTEGPKYGFVETYISVIKPTILFVRGGPSLVTSTGRSGFVLLPVAALLIAGVVALARRRDWIAFVIVAGVLVGPIPAAFKGEPSMIQRSMYLLPFLALLGGLGFAALWKWTSRAGRVAAIAVAALSFAQFGYFYYDYFGHYKLRSAFYYDPVAFGDVASFLLADATAPAFYFTDDVDDASVKWRYYAVKHGRQDVLPRSRYVTSQAIPEAASGSLLVTYDYTERLAAFRNAGWTVERVIADVDNRPAAVILRKLG